MGRPERPLDPEAGPVQALAWHLRQLRDRTGRMSYRQLAQLAHYSASTLSDAAKGDRLPSLEVTLAYARALGGDEAEWRARWQAAAESEDHPGWPPETPCPYQGLMAFEPEHGEWFFGRDQPAARLRELTGRLPVVGVFGGSGSGKSSLLRAGLLGALVGDARWRTMLTTPTAHPLDALSGQVAKLSGKDVQQLREDPAALDIAVRGALAGAPEDTRALLVVDQFEEAFTLCPDEQERRRFVDALLDLAIGPGRRTTVVIGVRADFIGHLDPRLIAALGGEAQLLVGPPAATELREIVLRPAARAGLTVDPDLLATVLADTATEPGALPLLSHALQETWRHRVGDRLSLAAYQKIGGVRGAIAQTAERVYAEMDGPGQQFVRRIFVRLTALGEGTEDTRRPVALAELEGVGDQDVLDRLAAARLVVVGEESAEVAHEALIRAWPRLHRWLTDDRANLLTHRRLTDAAHRWQDLRRDSGALYRGAQLAVARAWAEENPAELNPLESAFLQASRSLERRRARLLTRVAGVMAVLLVAALAAGGTAFQQGREAGRQQRIAVSHQVSLKALELLDTDADLAGLLAVVAYRLNPDAETSGGVISAAAAARRRIELNVGGPGVYDVALDPSGTLLAAAGADGVVTLWDPARRARVRTFTEHLQPGKAILARRVAYSGDGGLLASFGREQGPAQTGLVVVREPSTGREVFRLSRDQMTNAMAISPDGVRLAFGTRDGRIEMWNLRDGTHQVLTGHRDPVGGLAFSQDGRLLVSTSGGEQRPIVWDVATGDKRGTIPATSVHRVVFGNGHLLVTASDRLGVHLWDLDRNVEVVEVNALPKLSPWAWDISAPGGDRIALADENGSITIWDHAKNELLATYQDRTRAETLSLSLSRDGRRLVSAGLGGVIVVREPALPPFSGHSAAVNAVETSPDGTLIASAGSDKTIRLWDNAGNQLDRLDGHPDHVEAIAFSQDGRRLAAVTRDHHVVLWDLTTRKKLVTLTYDGMGASTDVAYHPDGGSLVAAALGWHRFTIDPAGTGAESPFLPLVATGVAYAPDGRMVVATSGSGYLTGWDLTGSELATETPRYRIKTGQISILDVAYSPDGKVIATGGADRTVKLWDATTGTALDTLPGHAGTVEVVAFSRDGRWLASAGSDRTIIVRDLRTREPVAVLSGHGAPVQGLTFTADGDLVSGGNDSRIIRWALDPERAAARICREVGRGLSPAEWADYLGSMAYQAICD